MIMSKLPMPDEIESPSVGDRAPLEAAQSRHVAALAKVEAISRAIDSHGGPLGPLKELLRDRDVAISEAGVSALDLLEAEEVERRISKRQAKGAYLADVARLDAELKAYVESDSVRISWAG